MRRALPLALVISCACAGKHAAPVVGNTTEKPAKRVARDPLGLAAGVVWTFVGTATFDDGGHDVTKAIELTTTVLAVEHDGDRTVFRVSGWPTYGAGSDHESQIAIEDGVVQVDGDPWIRISPKIESLACPEDEPCWSVEPGDPGFDVYFRTNPDVTVYHLDPARGITEFTYHHNGTTDDVELHRRD